MIVWAYLPEGWSSALFTWRARRCAVPGRGAGGKRVVSAKSVLFGRLAGSPPADYKSAIPGRRSQFGAPIGLAILSWVVDLPVAGFVGADSLQFA